MTFSRVDLNVDLELREMQAKLVADAKQKLGYTGFEDRVHGPLAECLRKHEIQPLNTEEVRRYKARKEGDLVRRSTKVLLTMLSLAIAAFAAASFFHTGHTVGLVFVGGVLIIFTLIGACNEEFHSSRRFYTWTEDRLSEYKKFVPPAALEKALTIRDDLSAAVFTVESLVYHEEKPTLQRDPFLKVELRDESYYIDYWDEKDFRNRAKICG